jgi:hypothetical protein
MRFASFIGQQLFASATRTEVRSEDAQKPGWRTIDFQKALTRLHLDHVRALRRPFVKRTKVGYLDLALGEVDLESVLGSA